MLRLPPFRYVPPRTAREAARALADHGPDAMAVAGGTDLYPNMKRRQFTPKVLVGLRGLPDATRIAANGSLTLGAMATLSDVAAHPAVRERWPAVARAAGLVSSPPLRNAGTIGGNLCVDTRCNYYNQTEFWRASIGYCMKKDGDICLVAPGLRQVLGAVLVRHRAGDDRAGRRGDAGRARTASGACPWPQLYGRDGIAYLVKRPDEVLTEIHVPDRSGWTRDLPEAAPPRLHRLPDPRRGRGRPSRPEA